MASSANTAMANSARVIWTRRRRLREGAGPPEAMVETAGWRRGCRPRRRAAAPALPDEVVVWEILVRLPAKALLRCRAVCRSWRRLTSAAGFLAAHHGHQPALPLVKFSAVRDRPSERDEDATLHACDLRRRDRAERRPVVRLAPHDDPGPYCRGCTSLHAACDGLLLLSWHHSMYVCNPATRECAPLPAMAGVAGMYLHRASGEYRVLHWNFHKAIGRSYYVLAVGSSEAPRPVVCGAAVLAGGMEHDHTGCRPPAPVMLRGCLHWGPGTWRGVDGIVVFDTAREAFRSMSSPAPPAGGASQLLEMDGALGVGSCDARDGTVRIWLLEGEAWSLRLRIQLPTVAVRAHLTSFDGETLVCYSDGGLFPSSSALFRCDNRAALLLREFTWRTLEPTITGHWFKESLVRHAFFQGQDAPPCFFQDL